MNKHADVVVTFNRRNLLNENIRSLLEQSFDKHDIIIVDNASTDGTADMVNSYHDARITILEPILVVLVGLLLV